MFDSRNILAAPGEVWVCGACGKQSKDKYGFQALTSGWDEACILNSVLCYEKNATDSTWKCVPGVDKWGKQIETPQVAKENTDT